MKPNAIGPYVIADQVRLPDVPFGDA
jgi:hypothetical protein